MVVLDDPWMPEQVRLLNPIDSSRGENRLMITTRIRELVPKATRVELPLMGKDEAVALLLDLANVEEVEYLKERPGSTWPPEAAYTIAAECGLLPITLTIAAQVVRSWGEVRTICFRNATTVTLVCTLETGLGDRCAAAAARAGGKQRVDC